MEEIQVEEQSKNSKVKTVYYQPFSSSHVLLNDAMNDIQKRRKRRDKVVPNEDWFDRRPSVISFEFNNENPGTIFNTFEKLTLNPFWDIREDKDFSTMLLGRHHMFYKAEGVPISYTNEYGHPLDESLNVKIELNKHNPINFFTEVNNRLVNDLQKEDIFDSATYSHYKNIKDRTIEDELEEKLNRKNVRRMSENHFVVSGFNLLYQEIKVNNDVINSVVPNGDFGFDLGIERTIVSLFNLEKSEIRTGLNSYKNGFIVSEKVDTPSFLHDGNWSADYECTPIIIEYLSNHLLKQVEYCYTGKIFMKYNSKLEVGDTITLMDDTASTYGIFRVDSYEHVLDSRGLITIANVKAVWDFKDPILDIYSNKIGYDLLDELGKAIEKESVADTSGLNKMIYQPKNKVIKLIMEEYLKYLVQSPKYTMLYHFKTGVIFENVSLASENSLTPTPMPLRFMPMFVRGKVQMPKNLKCVFFDNIENNYTSFLAAFQVYMSLGWRKAINSICDIGVKGISIIGDFLLSIYTLGLHELLKPLVGLTRGKAFDATYSKDTKPQPGEVKSMQKYNPYTGMISKFSDFSICFFNIQMRKTSDISQQEEVINKAIKYKEEFVSSLVDTRGFNMVLLVELYDSFSHKGYTYKDFLKKFNTSYFTNRDNVNEERGQGSPFNLVTKGDTTEHAATIFHKDKNMHYNISTNSVSIAGVDRNVMETMVEYVPPSKRKHEDENKGIAKDKKPYKYKIIWFHNLYGSQKYSTEIRKINIDKILNYYTKEYNSNKDKNIGYIIMADCNLEVVNYGSAPIYTKNEKSDEVYNMREEIPFVQKIRDATTISKSTGKTDSNLFDNVLISKNALDYVETKRIDYSHLEKSLISDHIPVYVNIDFKSKDPNEE